MMATVPYVTSGSGLRKFQTDGFLFDRANVQHTVVHMVAVRNEILQYTSLYNAGLANFSTIRPTQLVKDSPEGRTCVYIHTGG